MSSALNFNFNDRHLTETRDKPVWYRVNKNTSSMYVPPFSTLRVSPQEVSKCIAAVSGFIKRPLDDALYDWDNITFHYCDGNVECADALDIIEKLVSGKLTATDIETYDLSWDNNQFLAIGFAVSANEVYGLYNFDECLYSRLEEVLSNEKIKFIWHNGKFDTTRLKYCWNIKARVDEDTMLKHYVQVDEKRGTHSLKDLGVIYLQAPQWDDELDAEKRRYCRANKIKLSDYKYSMFNRKALVKYMMLDCIATYRLLGALDDVKEEGTDYIYHVLCSASNVFTDIECTGFEVNKPHLIELRSILEKRIEDSNKALDIAVSKFWNPIKYAHDTGAKFVRDCNLGSSKQLKWILEEALQQPIPSTDAKTMEVIFDAIDAGEITDVDVVNMLNGIKESRKAKKYMSAYVEAIEKHICFDGRIRGSYKLHGTETGRLSSSDPSMQTFPRDKLVKNVLKAKDGYALLQLDYSQAEARVMGVLAKEPALEEMFLADLDIHSSIAEKIFGPNFTKEQRTMAKSVTFGVMFGRGANAIAQQFKMSNSEGQKLVDDWFEAMPKVKEFIQQKRKDARAGLRQQSVTGRVRHYVRDDSNMYHIENEYINTPIQGAASDCTLMSLMNIHYTLKEQNIDARIVATVHDSIVIEVVDNIDTIRMVGDMCCETMARIPREKIFINCVIPFKADAEYGYTYGGLKPLYETD